MATLKFIQAQKFSLAGSGASIGDTAVILQSMTGIDGALLTTTDVGTIGFGTLEPGNGTQEEAISYTGITQNSNGTATLTGVKTVLFVSPYTGTSGLAKTHAGATTFILSNDAAFYGAILDYVDNSLMASGIPATNLVAGITKLSVAAVTGTNPIAVGDNDPRLPSAFQNTYITGVAVPQGYYYGLDTTGASAYAITLSPVPATLASGMNINFRASSGNSGAATLNVNSLGAKAITKKFNASLGSGDIVTSQVVHVVYDGTQFQMESPQTTSYTQAKTGSTTHDTSSATTQNIAHGLAAIPRIVRITGLYNGSNTTGCISHGTYDGTTNNNLQMNIDTAGTGNTTGQATGYAIAADAGGGAFNRGTITVDATNIIITWSKSGSPTGTQVILWEVSA